MALRGIGGDLQWVPVSLSALQELWTIFRTDVTIGAARNVAVSRILAGGVLYTCGDESPDAAFVAHVRREFTHFAQDVLEALMCQGFACFFVDAARSVPVCVPPLAAAYGVATEQKLFDLLDVRAHTTTCGPGVRAR